jgi:TRAP-type C4-dicarboxylate transport system permease small subunit
VVGLEYLGVIWVRSSTSPGLGINMFWPESIVVIGYVLMTLRLLQIYRRWYRSDRSELPGVSAEYQRPSAKGTPRR